MYFYPISLSFWFELNLYNMFNLYLTTMTLRNREESIKHLAKGKEEDCKRGDNIM